MVMPIKNKIQTLVFKFRALYSG